MKRFVILVSGQGSNMDAIVQAARAASWGPSAQFSGLIADRSHALALVRAQQLGLPSACVPFNAFAHRQDFETALAQQIDTFGADFILLAGFMRVLSAGFVARFAQRLVNIHPSLLPLFPGLHTHAQALAAGVKIHGATVHWVSEQLDHGPIIAQAAVPVLAGDDAVVLAARVRQAEHLLYPQVVQWLATGQLAAGQVVPSSELAIANQCSFYPC
jgi:phosphoribosylglycinamide formyltransferase 1